MSEISREELDEIYAFAVDLGKQAGQMLKDAAQLRMDGGSRTKAQDEHVQKMNAVDLVTETDEDVEAFIKNQITQKYPSHKYAEFLPLKYFSNFTQIRGRGVVFKRFKPRLSDR